MEHQKGDVGVGWVRGRWSLGRAGNETREICPLVARRRRLGVIERVRGACVAGGREAEEGSSLGDGGCAWSGEAFRWAMR